MSAPPGYLTAEHAARVLAASTAAADAIIARCHARLAKLLPAETDPAKAQAIFERETATALAELEQLNALTLERIGAGTEH